MRIINLCLSPDYHYKQDVQAPYVTFYVDCIISCQVVDEDEEGNNNLSCFLVNFVWLKNVEISTSCEWIHLHFLCFLCGSEHF